MKMRWVDRAPTNINYTDDLEDRLTPADVEHVAGIFQTPPTGA